MNELYIIGEVNGDQIKESLNKVINIKSNNDRGQYKDEMNGRARSSNEGINKFNMSLS